MQGERNGSGRGWPEVVRRRLRKQRERLPRIALRLDSAGELDDVVVKDVEMFRAEFMDEQSLWMACYLTNGERIVWWVTVGGKRPRAPLAFHATEVPEYEDFDDARRRSGNDA